MSVKVNPLKIAIHYDYEGEYIPCRKDILTFNYQNMTITTACDFGPNRIAEIITRPMDEFHIEIP